MAEELSLMAKNSESVMVEAETARAIQEVQAAMIIAKKFPRDQNAAYNRIMTACERFSLADQAEYAYPRGGQTVSGPSIRLAEALAQNWGNVQFGIRELSQTNGISEVEAFAWDLETNTRQVKTFQVEHKRYSKAKGITTLTDPRDIYEHAANQGARRMRACILGIIPGDIVEAAQKKCRATVEKGITAKPLIDQIRVVLKKLDALGVTTDMVEKRLGHKTDKIDTNELIELKNIGKSIQDNMTSRNEWFDVKDEPRRADMSQPPTDKQPVYDVKDLSGDAQNEKADLFANLPKFAKTKEGAAVWLKEFTNITLKPEWESESQEKKKKLYGQQKKYMEEFNLDARGNEKMRETSFNSDGETPLAPGAEEQAKRKAEFSKWCSDACGLVDADIVTQVLKEYNYNTLDEVKEIDYPAIKKAVSGKLADMGVEV